MRSPFAYRPSRGPLQTAAPGAAVAYLAALALVAFLYSNPVALAAAGSAALLAGLLAGARRALRAGFGIGVPLALLIILVNALLVDRGATVLARLGDWPLLGRVDVTLESLVAGAVIGLRALVVLLLFAVYSACVDPDRVLRGLRPLAGRSALTATLASRLVPVAAADAGRLRDAAALRGPGAAPVGRAALARRLLAGSLDRAVDVAATLELRGYGLGRRARRRRGRGRHDRRFYAVAVLLLAAAVTAKAAGADEFDAYPTLRVGLGAPTLALAAAVAASGLAPLRRPRRGRRARQVRQRRRAAAGAGGRRSAEAGRV